MFVKRDQRQAQMRDEISDQAQQKSVCGNNVKCFENSEPQSKNTRGMRNDTETFKCSQEDSKQDLQVKS